MSRPLEIAAGITIPAAELQFTFARTGGPGGQNVNKVNTKATLKWRPADSNELPAAVRARFAQRFAGRINQRGELTLTSDQHRQQGRNATECREKLRRMILAVLRPPSRRVKTRPTRASVERRLESKRRNARRKQQRRFRPED